MQDLAGSYNVGKSLIMTNIIANIFLEIAKLYYKKYCTKQVSCHCLYEPCIKEVCTISPS